MASETPAEALNPQAQAEPAKPAPQAERDDYLQTFKKAIENHKNGTEDKTVPTPFLVHRSDFKPPRTEDGYAIGSTFYEQGGLAQKNIELNDETPYQNSMNVHFAAQCTVSDHSYGGWEGRKYTVYAPYIPAIVENGLPETCITADTAFVSTDERVRLPGAILFEDVSPEQLGSDFIRTAPDGHILMANRITPENKESILNYINSLEENQSNKTQLEQIKEYIISGKEIDWQSPIHHYPNIDTIRDVIGANKLDSVPQSFFPGHVIGHIGDTGHLRRDEDGALADMLAQSFPDQSGFRPIPNTHGLLNTIGDALRHPELRDNKTLTDAINDGLYKGDESSPVHPKFKEMIGKLLKSDLYQELRGKSIANSLKHHNINDCIDMAYGIETRHHGIITKEESTYVFNHCLTPDQRQEVIDHTQKMRNIPDKEQLLENLTNMHNTLNGFTPQSSSVEKSASVEPTHSPQDLQRWAAHIHLDRAQTNINAIAFHPAMQKYQEMANMQDMPERIKATYADTILRNNPDLAIHYAQAGDNLGKAQDTILLMNKNGYTDQSLSEKMKGVQQTASHLPDIKNSTGVELFHKLKEFLQERQQLTQTMHRP